MESNSPISASPENTESGSPTPISTSLVPVPPETMSTDRVLAIGEPTSGNLVGTRKKRGRPRKYDAQGNLNPSYASTSRTPPSAPVSPPPGFSLTSSFSSQSQSQSQSQGTRRARSNSSSLTNWNTLPSSMDEGGMYAETAGMDFSAHILRVMPGEDLTAKIKSVGPKGTRAVCLISANGCISNVTIRPPGQVGGGLMTYEGHFEILSLSGSYIMTEAEGVTTTNGGLNISLANADGRVIGGTVVGWIIAASPIQMVVGSFIPFAYKAQMRAQQRSFPTATVIPASSDAMPAEILNLQPIPLGNEVDPPEMPQMPVQTQGEADDDNIGNGHNLNVASAGNAEEWNNGLQETMNPDINVSAPDV